jgi:hypothetical protein
MWEGWPNSVESLRFKATFAELSATSARLQDRAAAACQQAQITRRKSHAARFHSHEAHRHALILLPESVQQLLGYEGR